MPTGVINWRPSAPIAIGIVGSMWAYYSLKAFLVAGYGSESRLAERKAER
ncbi:MAG: hypothetical protein KGS72_19380 [Cyanobacteria bacterium REEB67]|nr:hypothetical protein [Cyanobacteria bacterium REEB67]